MWAPTRLFYSLREKPDSGLLAAAAAVATLFASTPFLLTPIAEDFSIPLGRSGLVSTVQVGAFAVTTFVAGRRFRTDRRFLVGASLAAVAFNLISMVAPNFEVLLVVRAAAGAAAGLLVWLSWANAMRTEGAMRSVAAVGPLTVFLAVPVISTVATRGGADPVFALVALAFLPPALLPASFAGYRPTRRKMSPSRTNVVLVIALGMSTLSGSAMFVFAAARGESLGMSPLLVAAGYSANAMAGWIAARRGSSDRPQPVWLFLIAACSAAVAFVDSMPIFLVAMTLWGFSFWMSTPPILRAIAAWSLVPEERVGDAQSTMAVGRALGPAVGAVLVGEGTFTAVGIFSVIGLVATGSVVLWVGRFRRNHEPPVGAVAR